MKFTGLASVNSIKKTRIKFVVDQIKSKNYITLTILFKARNALAIENQTEKVQKNLLYSNVPFLLAHPSGQVSPPVFFSLVSRCIFVPEKFFPTFFVGRPKTPLAVAFPS